MSDSLALIVIFAGIPLIVLSLVAFALMEAAGEHRDNVAAHLRRHEEMERLRQKRPR